MNEVITRLAQGCQADEFEQRVKDDIFAPLSSTVRVDQVREAKYSLQEMYHQYRKTNPCQASAFTHSHRCIYQVYVEYYEKLDLMGRTALPSLPVEKPAQIQLPRIPQRNPEDVLAERIAGMRKRITKDAGSDTSSE